MQSYQEDGTTWEAKLTWKWFSLHLWTTSSAAGVFRSLWNPVLTAHSLHLQITFNSSLGGIQEVIQVKQEAVLRKPRSNLNQVSGLFSLDDEFFCLDKHSTVMWLLPPGSFALEALQSLPRFTALKLDGHHRNKVQGGGRGFAWVEAIQPHRGNRSEGISRNWQQPGSSPDMNEDTETLEGGVLGLFMIFDDCSFIQPSNSTRSLNSEKDEIFSASLFSCLESNPAAVTSDGSSARWPSSRRVFLK